MPCKDKICRDKMKRMESALKVIQTWAAVMSRPEYHGHLVKTMGDIVKCADEALGKQNGLNDAIVMRKCAACGAERPTGEMKVCMDSRPMHRYVCDSKCMIRFYA